MNHSLKNLLFLLFITFTTCSNAKYSDIVSSLLELNKELNNGAEDTGVFAASCKNEIEKTQKSNENHFNTLNIQCASGNSNINEFITKLQNDQNDSKRSLIEWEKSFSKSGEEIKNADDDLKKNLAKIKANRERQYKVVEEYKIAITEIRKKIEVVRKLRRIISGKLLETKGPAFFVQLKKFNQNLDQLKNLLNNENDSNYAPLVSMLIDLASSNNFSNRKLLDRILLLLKNLHDSLKKAQRNLHAEIKSNINSLKKEAVNLQNIRIAYKNMRAQSFSKRVDSQHYIQFFKNEINHFEVERKRKIEERDLFKKICDFERKVHEENKKKYNEFRSKVLPYLLKNLQEVA